MYSIIIYFIIFLRSSIIFPANNNDTRRLQIKSLTLKCKSSNMVAIFEKTLSTHLKSETLQIPKGL
jgi:hypothetical protein